MKQNGRKSEEQKATLAVVQGVFGPKRPEPSGELSEKQADIWREIVAGEPPEFFNTAVLRSMLADLCRSRETIDTVNTLINEFQVEWVKTAEGIHRYEKLLGIRDRETRSASLAATRLRLTNQARYIPQGAPNTSRSASKEIRPWEM